jgi:hypothetical protein
MRSPSMWRNGANRGFRRSRAATSAGTIKIDAARDVSQAQLAAVSRKCIALDLSVENAFELFDFSAAQFVVANKTGEERRNIAIEDAFQKGMGFTSLAILGFESGLKLILATFFAGEQCAFAHEPSEQGVNGFWFPMRAAAERVDDLLGRERTAFP